MTLAHATTLTTLSHHALRVLAMTWRAHGPSDSVLRQLWRTPRAIVVTYQAMLLELLAFSRLPRANGRRVVVILGDGNGGPLLDNLDRAGIALLRASDGTRDAAWAEFRRRVEEGDIGLVPADAPDGDRATRTADVLRLARDIGASLGLAVTAASHSMAGWWRDPPGLPAPLSRVKLSLQILPPPEDDDDERVLAVVENELRDAARRIGGGIFPPRSG